MDAIVHLLKGVGFSVLAALIGTLLVAALEVVIALRDPKRNRLIRERTWRPNLFHMLH